MSFLESPRFPDAIAYGATGGPGYSTSIVVVSSGHESRNAEWSAARHFYSVTQASKTKAEFDAIAAFFRIAKGRANGFRFKDFSDFQATFTDGLLGTGAGTGLPSYQMTKRYVSGIAYESRTITKPVTGTASVKRNGSPVTVGAGAGQIGIDYAAGIVTFVADASSSASSITVGSTTQVVLSGNPGSLSSGQRLHLSGFTGADAALVNNLAHTINSVTGTGPYTFTLATNTAGKTITLGSGAGKKYPQTSDALVWAGEFDVPCRFDTDTLSAEIVGRGPGGLVMRWDAIGIVEIRA